MPRIRRTPMSFLKTVGADCPKITVTTEAPTSAWVNHDLGDFILDKDSRVLYTLVSKETGVATWQIVGGNGYDYQESVLEITDYASATATEGYRYLSNATSGDWTDDYIYEYSSGEWVGTAPSLGMIVFDENTDGYYLYGAGGWAAFTTGITTIAAATDTNIAAPASGQVLIWDGSDSWDNKTVGGDMTMAANGTLSFNGAIIVNADVNAAAAIAWSKMAALADGHLLVGSAGNVATDVPITGDLAILNTGATTVGHLTIAGEARGDIYYRNATTTARLAAGVAGQALVTAGAGADPYWGTPSVAGATSISNLATLNDAGANDAILSFTTQTVSAPTLTVPDFAGVSDEFVFKTLAVTMTNKTLTSPDINGGTADSLTGFSLRSSGAAFDLEFDTAEVLTAGHKISWDVGDADRTVTLGGNIALGGTLTTLGSWTHVGAHTLEITTTNNTAITLPTTGTLSTLDGGEVLTNKSLTSPAITGGSAIELTDFSLRSSGAAFDLEFDTAEVLTGDKIVSWNVGDTSRSITLGGNIALGGTLTTLGAWTQTGAHTLDITTTGVTAITLPTAGIVVATAAAPTNGQVIVGSTGASPVSATISHSAGTLTSTAGAGTLNIDTAESMIRTATVEISNAQLKALNGTPIQLVAAPGANKYIDFLGAVIGLNFVSTAMDDPTGDGDLQIRYEAGTVVSLTLEAAGFIDAAANAARTCKPLATDVAMATTKLELYNDGAEYTGAGGGDSTLTVVVNYRILDLS